MPNTPSVEATERAEFEEDALAYADQLYRIALRLSGSSQMAEELVQETYLRALRSWRTYRAGTNLAAWLATILRNAYLDEARRRSRRPVTEPLDDESDYFLYDQLSGGRFEGPQEALMSKLTNDAILRSLEEVPEHFREAVVLVDIGDFSYQEAADILDVPIGTVMSRLHRGRRQLKRALAAHALDGEEGTGPG
ncbi:MAG TPA: sigma-70 family RNA polymerase sigma factor [Gaiellales bacterium]|jgi:RNA polymerase sigma-70 factor (ECF subfamily)|nr:sigma-70 family RNA polymerase sigma factor [Gaiellales bacterium]